jgi:hypothetical protein
MPKMLLLFSHKLTETQIKDAKETLKVDKFVYLPKELQELFSQIPPELPDLNEYLMPIKDFIAQKSNNNDYILIQGDFGAVYNLINFANSLGLIAIYSTNKRVAKEIFIDNKLIKVSEFEHIRFRKY